MIKRNPEKQLRIYHGPWNIGGVGRYLADWQREKGAISDFITYEDWTHRQNHHINLQLSKHNLFKRISTRLLFLLFCIVHYDIYFFYFGITLLPGNIDLPILRLFRKKLIMVYCGSDIRIIDVERKRNPYSDLLKISVDHPKFDSRKKFKMRWHRIWVHRVIAIRNLYEYAKCVFKEKEIIKEIWVNNSLDINEYIPQRYETRDVPVLVHAPSEPMIKGTKYVEKAIEKLKAEGYKFEYRRVQNLPNYIAQKIYRDEADIIIDQFLVGGVGSLAFEGMYYGKPVVGYLLSSIEKEFCPDIPLVNATIDTLKDKLAWLINNPEERVRLGQEGRKFVEKYCDRDVINQKIWKICQQL